MNTERYSSNSLKKYLKDEVVATLSNLKDVLGTTVSRTVTRKLKELPFIKSYSHSGSYYSLLELAQFDKQGLWFVGSVRFSQYGTLLETLEKNIVDSEGGCFANELKKNLCVSVRETLLRLIKSGRIVRKKISGAYLYCSPVSVVKKRQLMNRQAAKSEAESTWISDEYRAAIILFVSLLDEQQRRLFAGLESIMWGYGGDRKIASLLGINKNTVAKGRQQLLALDVDENNIRQSGGGRKLVKKNTRHHR
jgi:arginine repressor